jgi:methionine-rich copper-binding protein CopC
MVKKLFLALAFCALSAPAFSCAMLDHADPKVGSVITRAPDHVTLTFSDKIYPEKSTLSVMNANDETVSMGNAYGSQRVLSVKVKPLTPGIYKVHWNTYCDCKSYMPGNYKFTLQ